MVNPADRPIRKDEVVLEDRGIYIESWLPERRSRRRPLVLVHGELGGSWLWEQYLGYFAHRGWEGHAINLRAHFWSDTTEVSGIDFESYVFDVLASFDHIPQNPVLIGHGMGGLIAMRAAEERHVAGLVLISPALPAELRTPPLSGLTWIQWRYDWPLVTGRHTFRVRATDGTGALQISKDADTYPDGATGYQSVTVSL